MQLRGDWPRDPIERGPDVLVGECRGVRFAHNPLGSNALLVLDRRADDLMSAANGRTIQATIDALAGESAAEVAAYLEALRRLLAGGYLRSPSTSPAPPPGPVERVFNTWVHITNRCNLDCPYCYVAKSGRHMSDEVIGRILDTIETTASRQSVDRVHVRFAGGEPMLRFPAMAEIHEAAKRRCAGYGVRFTSAVITNGLLATDEAIDWMLREKVWLSLSIDGVGGVQDAMRPTPGGGPSFRSVEQSIDRYLAAGVRPYALVTVGKSNLHGLPDLVSFLLGKELGFRLSLVRDFESGVADLDDQIGADRGARRRRDGEGPLISSALTEDINGVLDRVYSLIEDHVAARIQTGSAIVPSFQETHRFCDLELWHPTKKACGAGENYVAIGSDGQVSPCQGALHSPGTSPLDPSMTLTDHATGQRQLLPFLRSATNEECARCAYRHSCAGGCPLLLYRRDGHVNGRSPYCEVFRAVIPRILGIAALERSRSTVARSSLSRLADLGADAGAPQPGREALSHGARRDRQEHEGAKRGSSTH